MSNGKATMEVSLNVYSNQPFETHLNGNLITLLSKTGCYVYDRGVKVVDIGTAAATETCLHATISEDKMWLAVSKSTSRICIWNIAEFNSSIHDGFNADFIAITINITSKSKKKIGISNFCFSADSKDIIVACTDSKVRSFCARTGETISKCKLGKYHRGVLSMCAYADQVAILNRDYITIYDVVTLRVLQKIINRDAIVIMYDNTGNKIIAATADYSIEIFDIKLCVSVKRSKSLLTDSPAITISYSADRKHIVLANKPIFWYVFADSLMLDKVVPVSFD